MNWIIAAKMMQVVLGFFVGIYSARYLGPSNYGIINYTASYIAFLTIIAGLGIDDYIMKEMIDHKDQQGEALGSGILLRIISGLLSVVALYCILMITDANDSMIQTVAFLQVISLLFSSGQLLAYWYQMQLRSKVPSVITSIAYALMTVYKIVILVQGKDIRYFAFTGSLETLLIVILLLLQYKKDGGPKLSFSKAMCKDLLKNSYHFVLSGLLVVVFNSTDKIMLKQMMSETTVGYYSIASNLCNMWPFVLSAIIQSASPLILQAKKDSEELYIRRIKQCYASIIWISIVVSTIITIGAPYIINLLYGKDYAGSVSSLRILTWAITFSYLGVARGAWIVSEGLQKYVKYLTGIGAILNIIMNYFLIPVYGAAGASIATLATQIIVNFVAPLFIKELRPNSLLIVDAFCMKDVIKPSTVKTTLKELFHKK